MLIHVFGLPALLALTPPATGRTMVPTTATVTN
jgi:hypothetical protein